MGFFSENFLNHITNNCLSRVKMSGYKRETMESEDTRECEAMRKMFVGGLNRDTTEDTFIEHFGQYGNMVDKVIIKDPQSRVSRGFGFVTYDSSDSVEAVFQARPHVIDGKTLDVKRAMPRDYNTTTAHSKVTKLFIGGIGPDLCPEDLQEYIVGRHATSIGTVDKIDFLKERDTNKNKGFGFLECSDTDFADRLTISENSFTLKGRTMSLKKAEPKPEQGGGGNDRRGGGQRGRGGQRGSFGGRGGGGGRGGRGGRGGGGYNAGRSNNYDGGFDQSNGYNNGYSTGYPGYGANAGGGGFNNYQSQAAGGYASGASYGGNQGWGGGSGNRYQPY